jgi:hypothetical protein
MSKFLSVAVCSLIVFVWAGRCGAQSDAPYTEGPVWQITMVKTKYGMGDEYLKGLAKTFKTTLEEAKKEGLVMDYKILLGGSTARDCDQTRRAPGNFG